MPSSRPLRQPSLPGMEPPDEIAPQGESKEADSNAAEKQVPETGSLSISSPSSPLATVSKPLPDVPQPTSLGGKSVWVVDANSLIFQVFHALPEMSSPAGQPVNAVYGFTRDLLFLLEDKKPDFLFLAFDLPGGTFRNEIYDAYKANRSSMPEELKPQFPEIRRVARAMGIPVLDCAGFEADDILATMARMTGVMTGHCYIVTGDKDCRQLITESTWVYNIRKDTLYDAEALLGDWGIRPDQVVDFQSLVGDSVDNVPGVALIGPKIARELLQKYDTLEAVLDNAGELSGKKRKQNLLEGREVAMMCRRLVKLADDVPLELDWNAGRVGGLDHRALLGLFDEYGFSSFRQRIEAIDPGRSPKVWQADYQLVDRLEKLSQLVGELRNAGQLCVDTETTSLLVRQAQIVGYSFAKTPGEGFYVPVLGPEGDVTLPAEEVAGALRPILENGEIRKIGQNLKYDMVVLRGAGIKLDGLYFDTMIASYLLEAGERNHNLDDLAQRYLNHTNTKISELIGKGKNQRSMAEVPVAEVSDYACEDADVPLRLMPILAGRLEQANLTELFETLEMPLVEVLAELEFNGIRVDVDRLAELSEKYGAKIKVLETEIYQLAGRELNIASPKQLQAVLFDELGLPVIKKTKTGPSTDAGVLEELAQHHRLPAKIIEYRQYAKLKNTYVDALPKMVNSSTGRVHASFNQVVAATGRLSSSDPNLQNIPVRSQAGREIRSAFVAGHDGWKLLAADYSQIELRVLAHFCRDETLCAAFANDEDIHARVAAEVHGIPLDQVTPEQRRGAKAVNFGVIYGQSPFGLAKSLGIEQQKAAEFIESYFARYPGVDKFLTKTLAECRQSGYVSTILGRRRTIRGIRPVDPAPPDARGQNSTQRNLAERTAINTVIQGSAADLIKKAMIHIHRRMQQTGLRGKMLLQIHDELIFEVPFGQLDELARFVTHEMSEVMSLAVPLKVDVKWGDNWAECEPWETR